MSSTGISVMNFDVWVHVARYLQPADAINMCLTCRTLYKDFSHQAIWQAVYDSLLPGYPVSQFLVPDIVQKIERPDFLPLDGSKPHILEDWTQCMKQRIVYLNHVMFIQSNAVAALTNRTTNFMEPTPQPLYDMDRIDRLEQLVKAALPIDFVIFMTRYAHFLRIRQQESGDDYMALTSGERFENEYMWLDFLEDECNFEVFDQDRMPNRDISFENIEYFFCQMKAATFSDHVRYDFDRFSITLYLMLSSNLEHVPEPLTRESNAAYKEDLKQMVNGAGKVFVAHREFECWCDVRYVAGSFTDYMIQYTGIVLEYGRPPRPGELGSLDLLVPLPRDHSARPSILMPQPHQWEIGKYLPTYFTQENSNRHFGVNIRNPWHSDSNRVVSSVIYQLDNPEGIFLPNPPDDLFQGHRAQNWKPYRKFLESQNRVTNLFHLDSFGSGRIPQASSITIDQDIYNILKRMVEQWMDTTPFTVSKLKTFGHEELDDIRERTQDMADLFEAHAQVLPLALYYLPSSDGECYLWTHKLFMDHIHALSEGNCKYCAQDLKAISQRLWHQLFFVLGVTKDIPSQRAFDVLDEHTLMVMMASESHVSGDTKAK